MGIVRISPAEVLATAQSALGVPASDTQTPSTEFLAASLRRAASLMCPTSGAALLRTVSDAWSELPGLGDEARTEAEALLSLMTAYGDLVELGVDFDGRIRRQLFLGQPSYIQRTPESALLVGIRPEGLHLTSEDCEADVEHRGHVRLARCRPGHSIKDLLDLEDLVELDARQWMKSPRPLSPPQLVAGYAARLEAAGPAGDILGVRILDTTSPVTFYRGRWRALRRQDAGRFVIRRAQAYGADLWSYAEVLDGGVARLVDLPIQPGVASAADEAWRLQAAIDAAAGTPQRFAIHQRAEGSLLDFYSPLPSWAQRRLDIVGQLAPRSPRALFSYSVPLSDTEVEARHLMELLWMTGTETRLVGDDEH